ncbi:MAG: Bax inhibitor-1/YccA family protein [Pseudomonadota bacterium]
MNEPYRAPYGHQGTVARTGARVDAGLRSYMLGIYNYMASGVLLTGLVALITYSTPAIHTLLFRLNEFGQIVGYTGLGWVAVLAPLAVVFGMSFGINRLSASAAQGLFWGYAALMGLSLSSILFVYTGVSIAKVFFMAAAMFGALSLWGYTTKRDLSGWGTFLFMGLIGVIIASVVNMFLGSSMLDLIVSIVGLLVFAGLTAYDNQKLKQMYYVVGGGEARAKTMVMGALSLYLDFINMFLFLLRFFGSRE